MVMQTRTATRTYTKTDVKRVFESCIADIRMIALRTAAIAEQEAMDIMHDVQVMAEEGCLRTIHVQLCDRGGNVAKAHLYTATDGMAAGERPGGNAWPRMPEGQVRFIVTVDKDDRWNRAIRRFRRNWGASSYSLDYSGMAQSGTRTFSHGGYGLSRVSYG